MITIKDLARVTGLSPSTVSIVMRGEGDKRKISQETQERVLSAARKLGYTPNIQAKVLRAKNSSLFVITLFWASDIRPYILSRFLMGLQDSLIRHNYEAEIQVSPYKVGHLQEAMTPGALQRTNGAIICNASDGDMEFLESTEFPVPVVLYNRYSSKYPTVNMDDARIGRIPADVFMSHGRKKPVVLCSQAAFSGMDIRTGEFAAAFEEAGLPGPEKILVPATADGGYKGAVAAAERTGLPDCMFCSSAVIALGAVKALNEREIAIPEQIEIICIDNGAPEFTEYSYPSISVIVLPIEQMADECLQRLYREITHPGLETGPVSFPVRYAARQSCPEAAG